MLLLEGKGLGLDKMNNFTVITPNYNMADYLAETIESVLINLRPGDEYFIVDGGSSDGSVEIIRRYEHRISGWVSEKDKGYADALAKGFSRSEGQYQCWINCGDLMLPGALDEARARLEETGADMIFGDDLYIDERGDVLQVSNGRVSDLPVMMLYGGWTPLQDACFWRRSLYDKVGGVDPDQRYAADFDLFLRMSLAGDCRYVPAIFSAFRRHDGQTSNVHALGYRQERERCRQRELASRAIPSWRRGLLGARYWVQARWRARMQSRRTDMPQLIGRNVSEIKAQSCAGTGAA